MKVLEACVVEFQAARVPGDWAGLVTAYDATADESGAVMSLSRRSGETTVAAGEVWVKINQFEECVRRWRFGSAGRYVVSLLGGTYSGGWWTITARNATGELRLRVPQPSR